MKFHLTWNNLVELHVRWTPALPWMILDTMTLAQYESRFGFRQASQLTREA